MARARVARASPRLLPALRHLLRARLLLRAAARRRRAVAQFCDPAGALIRFAATRAGEAFLSLDHLGHLANARWLEPRQDDEGERCGPLRRCCWACWC